MQNLLIITKFTKFTKFTKIIKITKNHKIHKIEKSQNSQKKSRNSKIIFDLSRLFSGNFQHCDQCSLGISKEDLKEQEDEESLDKTMVPL